MKRTMLLTILILVSVCEARSPKTKNKIPDCAVRGAVEVLSGIIESFEFHTEIKSLTREEIIRVLKYDRDNIADLLIGEK